MTQEPSGLFGLPWLVWLIACLIVAALYLIIWPRPRTVEEAQRRTPWQQAVLRWFHSLVWLLLALACLLRMMLPAGAAEVANIVALLALPIYVIFMSTLIGTRRRQP